MLKSFFLLKVIAVTIILVAFFSISSFATGPRVYFPYSRISLQYPALEEPFPGMGSNYSCLSNGIQTALWNPAGLSQVTTAEQHLSLLQTGATTTFNYSSDLKDLSQTMGNTNNIHMVTLFTGDVTETTPITRELYTTNYTDSQGMPFSVAQAMRVTDWLNLGFSTKGDFFAGITDGGTLPITNKYFMDYANTDLGTGFRTVGGKLQYTQGGVTYETSQPLWSSFLTQASTTGATGDVAFENNIKVENNIIITASGNYGPVALGLNFIPISATTQINNSSKVNISDSATDFIVYTPNIDTSDPVKVVKWLQDPDVYGTKAGYNSNSITIPSGKSVADAAFKATYTGNTIRTDIGLTINLGTDVVLSGMIENFNASYLKMTGTGRTSYVTYRVNTAESAPQIDLTQPFQWNPFLDSPTPYPGYNYTLVAEKTFNLPRRIRYGILFKKPFILALDYEQQTNAFDFQSMDSNGNTVTTSFNNLRVLRIGTDFQIMILPLWMQLGVGLLFKPEVSGANAASIQQDLDRAFTSGVLPARVDLGLNTQGWGTTLGMAAGANALALLDIAQLDTVNADVNRTAFFSFYADHDPWRFTWATNLDEIATASVIGTKTSGGASYNFNMADLRWRSTYALSYRF